MNTAVHYLALSCHKSGSAVHSWSPNKMISFITSWISVVVYQHSQCYLDFCSNVYQHPDNRVTWCRNVLCSGYTGAWCYLVTNQARPKLSIHLYAPPPLHPTFHLSLCICNLHPYTSLYISIRLFIFICIPLPSISLYVYAPLPLQSRYICIHSVPLCHTYVHS